MFLKFSSQEERQKYGGTAFVEMQFCVCPATTPLEEILNHQTFWKNDSIYVYDEQPFYKKYKDILGDGIRNDMSVGPFDYYGITYYKQEQIDEMIDRAEQAKPDGYYDLIGWLEEAKKYNGFYVLGL